MRLIAWMLRFLGCLVLAAGTILAVSDIARSLASDGTTLMTIEDAARTAGLPLFEGREAGAVNAGVFASDGRGASLAGVLGRQPASVVLCLAGVLLIAIGRPPRRSARIP